MSESQKTGLFIACYRIDTPIIGGPVFNLNLTANTPEETVHGIGVVTQKSINPQLEIKTQLIGNFTYMTIMPDITHILVTTAGYPIIRWPPYGGIGPVLLTNVQLQMVLNKDWKSGTANYKYLDQQGDWKSINNAVVKLSSCPILT